MIAASTLRVLDLIESGDELRANLRRNTAHFRSRMTAAGFTIVPGEHPIAPVMLGDAALAAKFAEKLLERGVYVIGFSYPVVPDGQGTHPHADERRAHGRAARAGHRGIHRSRPRTRRPPLTPGLAHEHQQGTRRDTRRWSIEA